MEDEPVAEAARIKIDGKEYTADDFTFREQRAFRSLVRELAEDPNAEMDDLPLMDIVPALIVVIKRRDNPEYSLEEALDLKLVDLVPDEDEPRPTKGRAKKS